MAGFKDRLTVVSLMHLACIQELSSCRFWRKGRLTSRQQSCRYCTALFTTSISPHAAPRPSTLICSESSRNTLRSGNSALKWLFMSLGLSSNTDSKKLCSWSVDQYRQQEALFLVGRPIQTARSFVLGRSTNTDSKKLCSWSVRPIQTARSFVLGRFDQYRQQEALFFSAEPPVERCPEDTKAVCHSFINPVSSATYSQYLHCTNVR